MSASLRFVSSNTYLAQSSVQDVERSEPSEVVGESFATQDLYSVIQNISSARTVNPEIFGSSRFTEDFLPYSRYSMPESTGSWSDIDKDLQEIELELELGAGAPATSDSDSDVYESALVQSSILTPEYWGTNGYNSFYSEFNSLALDSKSVSDFENIQHSKTSRRRAVDKNLPWI